MYALKSKSMKKIYNTKFIYLYKMYILAALQPPNWKLVKQ
jgi:hypothetical protein